jgi:predicted O-linked N-acetylglucosamine transferase (SPINDLY family)
MNDQNTPPAMPPYLQNAVAAFSDGDLDGCFLILESARAAEPDNVKIVNNLGVFSAKAGRIDEAIGYFGKAAELDPGSYEAWFNKGLLLRDKSQMHDAREALERAVACRPTAAVAVTALAFVCMDLKEKAEGLKLLERAVELEPDLPERWSNLGSLRTEMGDYARARAALERALQLSPGHIQARYNTATLDYKVGDVEAAAAAFDAIVAEKVDEDAFPSLQRRYFPHLANDAYDGAALRAMGEAVSPKFLRPPAPFLRRQPRGEKLRVGFLSADFRRHSCAFFLKPLFEKFDRSRYAFHCFADFSEHAPDAISRWFEQAATGWHNTTSLKTSEIARQIADLGIDVLFELGGYTTGSLIGVCAFKPAPAIVAWLGFPGSTGLPEIGYRIGDAVADPPADDARHFSEKVVRLDGPFLCFAPTPEAPPVAPAPVSIVGAPTYGSFNNPHKIRPPVAAAWTRIVTAVPNAKLLVKGPIGSEPKAESRLRRMFAEAGLSADRLIVGDNPGDLSAYLAIYARADIALDPFPYNGTTTTCDSLWMGVPVVTMEGARHSARVGASLLRHAGLDELVAQDLDDYIAKAIELGRDRARLLDYRRTLRARFSASPVTNGPCWTRSFEAAIEKIYEDAFAEKRPST